MNAALRRMYSDQVNLDQPNPDDDKRSVIDVRLIVGPDGGLGEESFDVTVCTAHWLLEEASHRGPIFGRHLLIMEPMNVQAAARALRERVEAVSGASWDEVAEKLSRIGLWEFEDYEPSNA